MRARLLTAMAIAPVIAGMSAAGASGQASATVTAANFAFSPSAVTVTAGGTVTFTKSQGEEHDVHFSDQASGLQAPTTDAWTAMRTFATAGDYSFVCDIHAFMTGTVHVIAAPVSGPAPVAPGAPPGGVAPTAGSTPAADTVAPRATRLAGSLTVRRAVVRFRLGEAATVVVRIARRGSTRTVARVTRRLAAGDARITLRHRLRAGSRYTVSLRITDAAGNVSRRTVTFTARR